MAVPIPAPLPPWARAVLYLAPLAFSVGRELADYFLEADDPTELAWMRYSAIFDNTQSVDPADVYVTTWDFMNITGGVVDDTWNDTDLDAVQAQVAILVNNWCPNMSPWSRCTEIRAYKMGFNSYGNAKPFATSGPPVKIWPMAAVGTGTGNSAPQVALTVQERTARRRNWGRHYYPAVASNAISAANGRVSPTVVSALATLTETTYNGLMAAEYFPVVPVTQIDGVASRGLYTVSAIAVDDVLDVQRRRRYKNPLNRTILPIEP